jgi:hypothetical protein
MERKKRKVTKKRWFNYQVQEDGKIAVENQVQNTSQIKDESKRKNNMTMTFVNQFPQQQSPQIASPQQYQFSIKQQQPQQQQQQPQQLSQQQLLAQYQQQQQQQQQQISAQQRAYQFDAAGLDPQQYRLTFVNQSPQYPPPQYLSAQQQQQQQQSRNLINSNQGTYNFINLGAGSQNQMSNTTATIDSKQSEMILQPNASMALPSFNQLTRTQQQQQQSGIQQVRQQDPSFQQPQQTPQQQYLYSSIQQQSGISQQQPAQQQQWISENLDLGQRSPGIRVTGGLLGGSLSSFNDQHSLNLQPPPNYYSNTADVVSFDTNGSDSGDDLSTWNNRNQ